MENRLCSDRVLNSEMASRRRGPQSLCLKHRRHRLADRVVDRGLSQLGVLITQLLGTDQMALCRRDQPLGQADVGHHRVSSARSSMLRISSRPRAAAAQDREAAVSAEAADRGHFR